MVFVGAALASLWQVDPWALVLTALGAASAVLLPAALLPARGGAARRAAVGAAWPGSPSTASSSRIGRLGGVARPAEPCSAPSASTPPSLAAPAGLLDALAGRAAASRASVAGLLGSGGRALYTRALLGSLAITIAIHVAAYMLNAVLPFRATALGATGTQVGLLFSVTAGVAMFLRPVVGGWVDRYGVRAVLVPGVAVLALTSLGFHAAGTPGALILLMAGIGLANGLIVHRGRRPRRPGDGAGASRRGPRHLLPGDLAGGGRRRSRRHRAAPLGRDRVDLLPRDGDWPPASWSSPSS